MLPITPPSPLVFSRHLQVKILVILFKQDKRLIVMMSNCNHTREQIIPRLVESLEKHGYPETPKIQSVSTTKHTKSILGS